MSWGEAVPIAVAVGAFVAYLHSGGRPRPPGHPEPRARGTFHQTPPRKGSK